MLIKMLLYISSPTFIVSKFVVIFKYLMFIFVSLDITQHLSKFVVIFNVFLCKFGHHSTFE